MAQPSEPYVRGDLTVDYAQRRVTVAGRTVALSGIEYRMLVELSANAGRPLTHEHLLQRVWGPYQGLDFLPESFLVGDPLPQAGAGQHAELDFRHPFDKLRTGFNQLPCLGV